MRHFRKTRLSKEEGDRKGRLYYDHEGGCQDRS
jgi:hypothetical protein